MPALSLAAAAFRSHRGWEQNPLSVAFCIRGVSVPSTKHGETSSHYCRAAAPRSNECCSVFNWERVLLSKSYLQGNDCRNALR